MRDRMRKSQLDARRWLNVSNILQTLFVGGEKLEYSTIVDFNAFDQALQGWRSGKTFGKIVTLEKPRVEELRKTILDM